MTDRPDWRYHPLINHQQHHDADQAIDECPEGSCREYVGFMAIPIMGPPPPQITLKTEYVLQYDSGQQGWLDGGGPWEAIDEVEARKRLSWVRSAPQHDIFPRQWRLARRTTTEEVLDG